MNRQKKGRDKMHQIKRILSMLLIIAVTFTSIYLSDNYSSHAAGVNEETYYFKEAGYKSWSKTTNPEAIPVGLTSGSNANAAFVFYDSTRCYLLL